MGCGCCRLSAANREPGLVFSDSSWACLNVPESLSLPEVTVASCHGTTDTKPHVHEPETKEQVLGSIVRRHGVASHSVLEETCE